MYFLTISVILEHFWYFCSESAAFADLLLLVLMLMLLQ